MVEHAEEVAREEVDIEDVADHALGLEPVGREVAGEVLQPQFRRTRRMGTGEEQNELVHEALEPVEVPVKAVERLA